MEILFLPSLFFIEITAVRLHTDHGFQPPEAVHCIQSGKSKHTAAISTGGSTGTLHHHISVGELTAYSMLSDIFLVVPEIVWVEVH